MEGIFYSSKWLFPILTLLSPSSLATSRYLPAKIFSVKGQSRYPEGKRGLRRRIAAEIADAGGLFIDIWNFQFEVADFRDKVKETVLPYVEQLGNSRFFARVVRKGHKGEISGMETEKELDAFILESLQKRGKLATVNIEEFEKMIIVETVENRAGIGLITRDMKEKYPFVKVK